MLLSLSGALSYNYEGKALTLQRDFMNIQAITAKIAEQIAILVEEQFQEHDFLFCYPLHYVIKNMKRISQKPPYFSNAEYIAYAWKDQVLFALEINYISGTVKILHLPVTY